MATTLVLAAALAGCSSTDTGAGTGQLGPTTSPPAPSEQSQIYSAALHHLILVDNPFAKAPAQVGYVYLVDGPASRSSEMFIISDGPQFDADLKSEITAQAADLPPVEFVADLQLRARPARQGLTGVDNDGIIVGLSLVRPQWQVPDSRSGRF